MYSLSSNVESGKTTPWYYPFPLSPKVYGFAITAIIGIGGLAAGLVGTLGYFHVGAMGMAQLEAIIMMGTGFGSGSLLLAIAIAGLKKNLQSSEPSTSIAVLKPEAIPSIEQKGASGKAIFGKSEWEELDVTIIGNIPEMPLENLNSKMLLLIPEEVEYKGVRFKLTAEKAIEVAISRGYKFSNVTESFVSEIKSPSNTHWVLLDKSMASEANGKVKKRSAAVLTRPSILELLIANLMADHYNQELLWEGKQLIGSHTLCMQFQRENKTFILEPPENSDPTTSHTVRAHHFTQQKKK